MPAGVATTSDAVTAPAIEQSSPMEDVQASAPIEEVLSEHEAAEESDEDAEGEPDEDFDVSMQAPDDDEQSDDGSDSQSARPGKRKQAVEEEDYIMKDPELYGLRRSVCTTLVVHSLVLR